MIKGSGPLGSTHGAVAKLGSCLNSIEKVEVRVPPAPLYLRVKPPASTAQVAFCIAKEVEICYTMLGQMKRDYREA